MHKGGIILSACAMVAVVGCEKKAEAPVAAPPLVQVMTVGAQDIPITHTWVGTLVSNINAEIRAQVSGYLLSQDYQNGEFVKAGDLMFQIDPRPFQASLDQAEGQFAQAQAQLTKDKLNADRSSDLYKKQVISRQQYDDTLQAYQASKAAAQAAQAAVESARLNLEFTRITSPIDGISSIATAQVGDLVGPSSSTALATVTQVDPIKVNFSAAETGYIDFIQQFFSDPEKSPVGRNDDGRAITSLSLTLANGQKYPRPGKLTAVDNVVNVGTGSLLLQGLFPNPGNLLRPGGFGLVTAIVKTIPNGIAIPQRAVTDLQGTSQVAVVVDGNKIEVRTVTVGPTIGSLQVIENGLSIGDTIVVEGLQKIKDGSIVKSEPYKLDAAEADSISSVEQGLTESAPGPTLESSPTPLPSPTEAR